MSPPRITARLQDDAIHSINVKAKAGTSDSPMSLLSDNHSTCSDPKSLCANCLSKIVCKDGKLRAK